VVYDALMADTPRRRQLDGLHVLTVEDNSDARGILKAVLEYFGAFVTSTENAAEALRLLRQSTPDVVIADVHLPDHDAMWLLKQAERIRSTAPFIAVSAEDLDALELAHHGFNAFLRKPLDHRQLVEAILAVVGR
jgi:CheY-like chemotaxis protein